MSEPITIRAVPFMGCGSTDPLSAASRPHPHSPWRDGVSNMDYQSWRCIHERNGENKFCPPEGCPIHLGCARVRGWKYNEPTPPEYQGFKRGPAIPDTGEKN